MSRNRFSFIYSLWELCCFCLWIHVLCGLGQFLVVATLTAPSFPCSLLSPSWFFFFFFFWLCCAAFGILVPQPGIQPWGTGLPGNYPQRFFLTAFLKYNLHTIKVHSFKVYKLMVFSIFTELWSHHNSLSVEHFIISKRNLYHYQSLPLPYSHPPQPCPLILIWL